MSSNSGFTSLEDCLKKHIPADELSEVKRILYGRSDEWVWENLLKSFVNDFSSCSNELEINGASKTLADSNNFEIKSYGFTALPEDLRKPRIVKIGAVQNSIAVSTSEPIHKQRDAIFHKIGKIIDAAGADGVNVLCLQEAWSKQRFCETFLTVLFIKMLFSSNAVRLLYKR